MYAFGHVLYLACYGRLVHGLPWTKFSCKGSPDALAALLPVHEAAHPAVSEHSSSEYSTNPEYSMSTPHLRTLRMLSTLFIPCILAILKYHESPKYH